MTSTTTREVLSDLPPSSKLVVAVLETDGPLTQKELAEKTLMPPRTVRYGIERLDDENLIITRPNVFDARQNYYLLADDVSLRKR